VVRCECFGDDLGYKLIHISFNEDGSFDKKDV
jgi:hypothetical protein